MKKRVKFLFSFVPFLFLIRCATDPGSSTPVSGSAICTYDNCDFDIILNYSPPSSRGPNRGSNFRAATVAFGVNSAGKRVRATSISSDLTITYAAPTFTVTNCASSPSLIDSSLGSTFKMYVYQISNQCTETAQTIVAATASVTIADSNGNSRTTNMSGSGGGSSSSLTEHVVFVTSTTSQGNFGGLAAADATCASVAASGIWTGSLTGGVWRAILSDSTHTAASRLDLLEVPIVNDRGDRLANNPSDLWDGALANPVKYNESGISTTTRTWTGSNANGGGTGGCANWSNTLGTSQDGDPQQTDYQWIVQDFTVGCAGSRALYCIYTAS